MSLSAMRMSIFYGVCLLVLCLWSWRKNKTLGVGSFNLSAWSPPFEVALFFFCNGLFINLIVPRIIFCYGQMCFLQPSKTHLCLAAVFAEQIVFALYLFLWVRYWPSLWWRDIPRGKVSFSQILFYFGQTLPIVWASSLAWGAFCEHGLRIPEKPQWLVEAFAAEPSWAVRGIFFIFAAGIGPLIEELFFRAALYRWLKSKLCPGRALVISSFVFASLHFSFSSLIPLFLLGIFLGRFYEKTQSIWGPIGFHALFNANTLLCVALGFY